MPKKLLKVAAYILGGGALLLVLATIALRLLLPPEKIRALIVGKAQAALHREVRLHSVSLGVVRGLALEGLEISEAPDFKAGKFVGVNAFELKFKLAPLLHKKIVIDEIYVFKPMIAVRKNRKGVFNFADLTAAPPPAAKPAETKAAEPLPFELDVRRAEVKAAEIAYVDDQAGQHVTLRPLDVVAKDFSFDAPTGRMSATLEKFGAVAAGLALEVAGKVKFDPKHLDVSDWAGKFDGERLSLSMTADDYATAPNVKLNATLAALDLGKLMAAKQSTTAQVAGKSDSGAAPAAAPAAGVSNAPPMKSSGGVDIGKMTYSGAIVKDTKLSWQLTGITPDLRGLAGWAKLHNAGGSFTGDQKESGKSGIMKALMMPITILQKVGSLLLPFKVLPDLSHLVFAEAVGDYVFERGVMTIKDFHLVSATVNIKMTGSADLANQKVNMVATMTPAGLGPIDVDITGTFDNPSVKPRMSSLIGSPAASKLKQQAGQFLKGLFGH